MRKLQIAVFGFVCALPAFGAESKIIAPGETLQTLADTFAFSEGPCCDSEGNVFFTDQPNDRILKWSVDGKLTTFMQPCGRANGLSFDYDGNLWVCADEKNQMWRINAPVGERVNLALEATDDQGPVWRAMPAAKVTVVVKDYQGKLLNGPNDVWVRPGGGIYFTDPYYKRSYWKRGPKEIGENVYFLAADNKTLTCVISDFRQPNGIIGTPDGKLLYVADIGANKTWRYRIQPDGSLTEKTLFCQLGSDGMTIDDQGNVYLTGHGVTVFDAAGKQIEHIDVPQPWTGNICFGGKDRQTLFITASKCLYSLRMQVKGVDSQ
jgi:gluconolactonase